MKRKSKYIAAFSALVALLSFATQTAWAQVGIGNVVPENGAILDLTNTNNRGFKLPTLLSPQGSAVGMLYYDNSQQKVFYKEHGGFNGLSPWKFKYNYSFSTNTYLVETGNVGIGTSTPSRLLQVHINSGVGLLLESTSKPLSIEFYPTGFSNGTKATIGLTNSNNSAVYINQNNSGANVEFAMNGGTFNVQGGQLLQNGAPLVPSGTIGLWNSSSPPSGWVVCDGSSFMGEDGVARTTPDLRGYFVAGYNNPNDTNFTTPGSYSTGGSTAGKKGGVKTVTLTVDNLPAHNHGGNTTEDGEHNHGITLYGVSGGSESTDGDRDDEMLWRPTSTSFTTRTTNDAGAHQHTLSTVGSGQSHNNLPQYYTLIYIMKK